jgi:tRNA threonylcarbamoyladenosine biosynthesis protein TsaE
MTSVLEEHVSSSPEETERLAARLARELSPGSVVALRGPLGAGKTVFVRGLCRALGIDPRTVSSPTFTIINEYGGTFPLYHIDLYRIETPAEAADLGLDEYFDRPGIVALEWPERAESLLPPDTVNVVFRRLDDRSRAISVAFPGSG